MSHCSVILLVWLLFCLSCANTENMTGESEGMAEPPFHRIRKCCPAGSVLDDLYTCVAGPGDTMDRFMAQVSNLTRQNIPEEIYKEASKIQL